MGWVNHYVTQKCEAQAMCVERGVQAIKGNKQRCADQGFNALIHYWRRRERGPEEKDMGAIMNCQLVHTTTPLSFDALFGQL